MKKLLIIPMLFVCFVSYGQTLDSASIIGEPIRLGNLLFAQNNFPNEMTYDDAVNACASLGPGWRLPTVAELSILFQKTDYVWNSRYYYWSSNICVDNGPCPFGIVVFFDDGDAYLISKTSPGFVRAVRAF